MKASSTSCDSALDGARPVPGAVETVRAIHHAGIAVGVISSAVYHPFLEWTLSAFGIRDRIAAVVTSASAGYYKSRPELYWHAADLLRVAPRRVVHVGDSLRFDVGGASRAGMGTVWLQANGASTNDDTPSRRTLPCSHWKLPRRRFLLSFNRVLKARNGRVTGTDNANRLPIVRFDVFTIFPGMFSGPLDESILRRAQDRGLVSIAIHDIRDWASDRHRTVDDTPYGGGAGMVMKAPPIVSAVEETLGSRPLVSAGPGHVRRRQALQPSAGRRTGA